MSYGAKEILNKYCSRYGFKINGEMQHGWNPAFYNSLPEMILGSDGRSRFNKNKTYYVARKDQKEALLSDGYTNVQAIGLPIVYLQTETIPRVSGSLLIMPDHTLLERDGKSRDQDYFDYLSNFRQHFSSVTLCLHRACHDKKRWEKLSQLADKVVVGADPCDKKSIERVAELMSAHEFMTTNDFGSHVPYAAYYGCKVSVCGPRPIFNANNMTKSVFYQNCPECLEMRLNIHYEDTFGKSYPFLMVEPKAAGKNEEWARWELGMQCKKSPTELRKILGWYYYNLPIEAVKYIMRIIYQYAIYTFIALNFLRYYGIAGLKVILALKSAKKMTAKYTELPSKSRPLKIRNRSSDIDVVIQHYGRRELLDISYPKYVKIILDLGANIGVSVMAFRSLFPKAKIIAVEMNAENFHLLKENCSMDSQITLENAAVWSEDGSVSQVDVGDGEWGLRCGDHPGKSLDKVPSFSFETILRKNGLDHVDVCKMDIEGAEKEVLESSWQDIFKVTKLLIVEVHDWIPGCTQTVGRILEEASEVFNLKISKSGEFTLIENQDL